MSEVPKLPRETLHLILGILAADPTVEAVYVGGSISRREDDDVSDVDLWIEGENWQPESLGQIFATAQRKQLGDLPFVHGVTIHGTILDILVGTPRWGGVTRLELPEPTPFPASPLPPCGLVEEFWISQIKHRKNIWRGYHGLVILGLHFDRQMLMRAWIIEATGTDPGEQIFNIFGMKPFMEICFSRAHMELVGLPTRDLPEIIFAIEAYRAEMSRIFPIPPKIEVVTRALPLVSR